MIKNQHRFFVSPSNFQGQKILISDKDLIHQISKVLRLRIGDQIIILDNSGFEYLVNLEKINDKIEGFVREKIKNENEPNKKIVLCQSLLKSDKFEQVLKFCTNLGISEFIPFISKNSIVKEISPHKLERYQKIIRESAEQSGRAILPKLKEAMDFEKLINLLREKDDLKLIAWEKEKKTTLSELRGEIKKTKTIYLLIGPEGGFAEGEIVLAKENGFIPFSLGNLVLCSEIAGLIASALILA